MNVSITKIKSIRLLYDQVLVRPLDAEGRTSAGLYIPEIAKGNTPYARGQVVHVGPGRVTKESTFVPLQVKEGDLVMYQRKAGTVLPINDEHLVLLAETEVIATFEIEEHAIDLMPRFMDVVRTPE